MGIRADDNYDMPRFAMPRVFQRPPYFHAWRYTHEEHHGPKDEPEVNCGCLHRIGERSAVLVSVLEDLGCVYASDWSEAKKGEGGGRGDILVSAFPQSLRGIFDGR
jgi:hypothetical protein